MFGQIYFRVLGIGCFLSMALLLSAQSKLDSLHHLNEVVVTARINKEVIPVQSGCTFGSGRYTLFFRSTNKRLWWNRRAEDR